MNTYTIQNTLCNLCSDQRFLKEAERIFINKYGPALPYEQMPNVSPEIMRIKPEFMDLWCSALSESRIQLSEPCFTFTADCGGDSISICYSCLLHIAEEIKAGKLGG